LGCSLGGILVSLRSIRFCLTAELAIAGSSNVEIPGFLVGGGPREEGEKTMGEVVLIRRRERGVTVAVFASDLVVKES
jgi:hypothetical protein